MTILKPGKTLIGQCTQCDCKIECYPKEAKVVRAQTKVLDAMHEVRVVDLLTIACPACDATINLTIR